MVAQLIDPDKTAFIDLLLETSFEKRSEDWNLQFNRNIISAALENPQPRVIQGSDGFHYSHLRVPTEGESVQLYSIASLKVNLLQKGWGVVINAKEGETVRSFQYGDILNVHINQELITHVDCLEPYKGSALEKEVIFFTGQPAEEYLPSVARRSIFHFLTNKGITEPKVTLIGREIQGEVIHELAFNIHSEYFASHEEFEKIIDQLRWFLPRHYRLTHVPDQSQFTNEMIKL